MIEFKDLTDKDIIHCETVQEYFGILGLIEDGGGRWLADPCFSEIKFNRLVKKYKKVHVQPTKGVWCFTTTGKTIHEAKTFLNTPLEFDPHKDILNLEKMYESQEERFLNITNGQTKLIEKLAQSAAEGAKTFNEFSTRIAEALSPKIDTEMSFAQWAMKDSTKEMTKAITEAIAKMSLDDKIKEALEKRNKEPHHLIASDDMKPTVTNLDQSAEIESLNRTVAKIDEAITAMLAATEGNYKHLEGKIDKIESVLDQLAIDGKKPLMDLADNKIKEASELSDKTKGGVAKIKDFLDELEETNNCDGTKKPKYKYGQGIWFIKDGKAVSNTIDLVSECGPFTYCMEGGERKEGDLFPTMELAEASLKTPTAYKIIKQYHDNCENPEIYDLSIDKKGNALTSLLIIAKAINKGWECNGDEDYSMPEIYGGKINKGFWRSTNMSSLKIKPEYWKEFITTEGVPELIKQLYNV